MGKYIYPFEEAINLSSNELGGKGASLVRMTSLNIPVPPGFIITTDAGLEYSKRGSELKDKLENELHENILRLEKAAEEATGYPVKFGDKKYPLLISVRSGAPISMPGQMSTLLNVGLTSSALDNSLYDEQLSHNLYWRLYKTYALGIGVEKGAIRGQNDASIEVETENIKKVLKNKFGKNFIKEFENPYAQLWIAIKAVWDSWNTTSNQAYRESLGLSDNTWTAVVIQMMVLGNKNSESGTGVVYSRDLRSGDKRDPLPGSYLTKAQGEEVVSGEAKVNDDLGVLKANNKEIYKSLVKYVELLEKEYQNPQDIEFTIENGKLWLLQSRTAPLSDRGLIQFVVDSASNTVGIIQTITNYLQGQSLFRLTEREAVERIRPSLMERLYLPVFSTDAKREAIQNKKLIAKGIPASPGVAVGKIAVTLEAANQFVKKNQTFIWVRDALDPKEHQIMRKSAGVISIRSSVGSHGAIMANVLKRPCVVCCDGIDEVNETERYVVVNGKIIHEDEDTEISVDAITGEIFLGGLPTEKAKTFSSLITFEQWWNDYDGTRDNRELITPEDGRPHSPWGNATLPSMYLIVDKFRDEIRQLLTAKGWNTEKAQVVEAMHIIPEEMRIKQVVVDAKDKDELAQAMRDVFKKRQPDGTPLYWNGPRTALGPGAEGAAPWQMGMNRDEQIDEFLTKRDFKGVEKAKSGGYPRWINPDPSDPWKSAPVQIIVMYDPAEKGVEAFENEHFVCNVSCRSNPDEVMVDVNLGTAQLRSFEKIAPDSLIRLSMELNPIIPDYRGKRTINFGKKYWDFDSISTASQFRGYNKEDLGKMLEDRMRNGELSEEELLLLVGSRTLKIANFIKSKVFGDWWLNYQLPYRMRALDEVFSLQVLELQGRADSEGNVVWFLVYDAKGRDEKTTIAESK